MKANDLEAIKARAEKATPPPWGVYHNLNGWHYTKPGPEGTEPVLTSYDQTKADVEFIATARDDVPLLCREFEALEQENARLRDALTRCVQLAEQAEECTDWEYVGGCLRHIQREVSAALEYTDS